MGLNFRNIVSLFCMSVAITLTSCKPDAAIATYSCHKHYYSVTADKTEHDSVIGYAPVTVYKSSSDGTTLIINGKTTGVYSEKYSNSKRNAYITDYSPTGEPQLVYFISGDSIWMQTNLVGDRESHSYYYFSGHKQ